MHRAIILATSLSCLAFSECQPGKVSLETDTADTNANFWCGFYTSTVVYGAVTALCSDELNRLDDVASEEFYENALATVLADCTDYVNGAADPEAVEYVVKHVCRDGYDEESADTVAQFESLTCEDVLSADLAVTWPYEPLCPCIDDGAYETTEDGRLVCSPIGAM